MIYQIPAFLKDFIGCESVKRLKGIDMNCGMYYTNFPIYQNIHYYSRYEHSIGVACIVWKYTHDMKQTLAGLFHDIATPVFSHTIDFMNGDYLSQESTEANISAMIASDAKLMQLLNQYHISIDECDDYHIYPIADNEKPKLCADRLEYTLSNAIYYGMISEEEAEDINSHIIVGKNEYHESELIFDQQIYAVQFANIALQCSHIYTSQENRYGMEKLSRLIQKMINHDVLSYEDLYTDETLLINKIEKSVFRLEWKEFLSLSSVEIVRYHHYANDVYQVNAKKRYIDPYIKGIGRVSSVNPYFQKELEEYLSFPFNEWMKGKSNE